MARTLSLGALILGRHHPDELRRLVRNCEAWGYEYFWHADERFFRDVYANLAVCALETSRIKLGTGVTDPYSRHPALTAVGIATIDELSGGRAVLGIGTGVAGFAELGIEAKRPAKAIREAVQLIRQLLGGGYVTLHGEVIHFEHGILDVPGRGDLPVYIAAKGPLNIQLAGEIADGLIISSCVADASIDHTRALLAKGAAKSGRTGTAVKLASRVNICIAEAGASARQAVKPMLAALLISKKPDFSFLEPLGLTMPARLAELVETTRYGHDPSAILPVAHAIPDDFVEALAVAGTPDDVVRSVSRMASRGVDQLIAYPMPDPGQTHDDILRRLAQDVMPRVQSLISA